MSQSSNIIAVVGAFARIAPGLREEVRQHLNELDGVETFDLDDERLGILIEAAGAKEAEEILEGPVRCTPGVWGVWPVSVELEDQPDRIVEQPGGLVASPGRADSGEGQNHEEHPSRFHEGCGGNGCDGQYQQPSPRQGI